MKAPYRRYFLRFFIIEFLLLKRFFYVLVAMILIIIFLTLGRPVTFLDSGHWALGLVPPGTVRSVSWTWVSDTSDINAMNKSLGLPKAEGFMFIFKGRYKKMKPGYYRVNSYLDVPQGTEIYRYVVVGKNKSGTFRSSWESIDPDYTKIKSLGPFITVPTFFNRRCS